MTYDITDSSAYVGRFADGSRWPWWVRWPLLAMAFGWGLLCYGRR